MLLSVLHSKLVQMGWVVQLCHIASMLWVHDMSMSKADVKDDCTTMMLHTPPASDMQYAVRMLKNKQHGCPKLVLGSNMCSNFVTNSKMLL